MPPVRMHIDRLAFSGPERDQVVVHYGPGLTILWGASNHGKSFTAKAVDFLLGARGALSIPPEGRGMNRCTLWLSFGDGEQITLQRGIAGGAIEIAEGHHDTISTSMPGYASLGAQHAETGASLSTNLLDRLGFRRAELLKNERAEKVAFTFRQLMRHVYVDEKRIVGEDSVTVRKGDAPTAEDKSLLKFIVTGIDGSAVATVPSKIEQTAARNGKITVLKELLESDLAEIDPDRTDEALGAAIADAEAERGGADAAVRERQNAIDAARSVVNTTRDLHRDIEARTADLRAMSLRFNELRRTLISDITRLEGLEEGGFLTRKFAQMNCPLCGADPAHQHDDPHLDRIAEQQAAVASEIAKIKRERAELDDTLSRIRQEIEDGQKSAADLQEQLKGERATLSNLAGDDRGVRERFVAADETLRRLREEQSRRARIEEIERRITVLKAQAIPGRPKAEDFDPSLSTAEAHDLALVVKRVLVAWGYPNVETVIFDLAAQDLIVDGKERRGNGKGVRAILHSAFQVALLIHCHEQQRPHPGFLILDTPLRAYRAPSDGEVRDEGDEALAETGLNARFYAHLASLSDVAQFIVIENDTPPGDLPEAVKALRYDGGQGLFN